MKKTDIVDVAIVALASAVIGVYLFAALYLLVLAIKETWSEQGCKFLLYVGIGIAFYAVCFIVVWRHKKKVEK